MKIFGKQGTTALPTAAFVALALAASGGQAQTAEVLTLDIEAQQAGSALMELANSSGAQIMVSEQAGAEVEVESLQGEFRLEEALAAMLTDTGLKYEFTSENVVLVQQEAQSGQLEEVEAPEETAVEEEEDPLELAPQQVTGTRLPGGDPSAQVYSYSAEDIARRGVSNLEEFFRKMPWAFPSMTTQSYGTANEVNRGHPDSGPDFDAQIWGLPSGVGNVGVSAINLRGLGSPNTLVLLNGRRIAGTGGQEADFANLLNVPLSSIERVDIQLGGASAIYGSDAIGGVVNFITRKDYRGLSATWRQEFSSTDADATSATIRGGYGWNSGNASIVLSRNTSDPITNAKAGFGSLDQRSIFGPESSFDGRYLQTGQPGVACELVKIPWSPPPWNPNAAPRPPEYRCPGFTGPFYQLPPGHTGEGASIDDFEKFNLTYFPVRSGAPYPYDSVAPQNGADSTRTSLLLQVEQSITENLRVFADVRWSLNDSYQNLGSPQIERMIVPASNAWNPFGKHMLVSYAPVYEAANGLMPAEFFESEDENRTIGVGFIWSFDALGATQELQLDINRTKSWRESSEFRAIAKRGARDPTAEAFYAALSSSDPAVAINVFGNGTAQGSAFEEFLTRNRGPYRGVNETRQYNVVLRGELFRMWGGPIVYSVGGEYRENIVYSDESQYLNVNYEVIGDLDTGPGVTGFGQNGSLNNLAGVERPRRDTQSWFAELALPFVNPDNALPGVDSLVLTLQARRDTNESEGSIGGRSRPDVPIRWHYWDPDEGFTYVESSWGVYLVDPNLVTAEFGRVSPRIGIQYRPVADFTFRASWQRNYRSPTWRDQFGPGEPETFGPWVCFPDPCTDPFDPDGPTLITRASGVTQYLLDNAEDIREEYSDNYSASFDWWPKAIPGLRWGIEWERADFTNKIVAASGILNRSPELILDNPQIAVRNERGDLTAVTLREINLAEALNETISTRLEYSFDTDFGTFIPSLRYTRYIDDFERVAPGQEQLSALGTQRGNDVYTWQGALSWSWNRLAADMFVYYKPGYTHRGPFCQSSDLSLPGTSCTRALEYIQMSVSSLTTVDLTLTYTLDNGLRIRAGGQNILDRPAPNAWFYGQAPYDPTRWDARGQVLFLELNWEM